MKNCFMKLLTLQSSFGPRSTVIITRQPRCFKLHLVMKERFHLYDVVSLVKILIRLSDEEVGIGTQQLSYLDSN